MDRELIDMQPEEVYTDENALIEANDMQELFKTEGVQKVYVHFNATTPYCGTDDDVYDAFDAIEGKDIIAGELTAEFRDFLQNYLQDVIDENAGQYSHNIDYDDGEDEQETDENREQAEEDYYGDCGGSYEIITEEDYEENK